MSLEPRVRAVWVVGALLLGGCHLLFPFDHARPAGDASGADGGQADLDLDLDLDLKDADAAPPGDALPCPPSAAVKVWTSTAGDWSVALPVGYTYANVSTTASIGKNEAAAIVDLPDKLAGFVVSLPTSAATETAQEAFALASIKALGTQPLTLLSGVRVKTHDNHPAEVGHWISFTPVGGAAKPTDLRRNLIAALLPALTSAVPNKPYSGVAAELVVAFATIRRGDGRLLLLGAIADRARAADPAQGVAQALRDLADGTALAPRSYKRVTRCARITLNLPRPRVDLIVVSDESGSMAAHLAKTSAEVTPLFTAADRLGLDLRVGVTGMKDPNQTLNRPSGGWQVGKLCAAGQGSGDGGADLFLTKDQLAAVQSCVQDPPYYEGGYEYGLAAAYEAVTRHLPRGGPKDLSKIRQGATLALLIISDETPEELKVNSGNYKGQLGFMTSYDYQACTLPDPTWSKLKTYLKPWLDLYLGSDPTHGAQGQAVVYLLSSSCFTTPTCLTQQYPWGYIELVQETGGRRASLCQSNLGPSVSGFIADLAGWASPLKLPPGALPISPSMTARLDGAPLPLAPRRRVTFHPASRHLILDETKVDHGGQLEVAFDAWIK